MIGGEIVVDLFAGGGGASEGIGLALGKDPDVAINHDPVAIAMHKANHPSTTHFIQNIREVSPLWATRKRPVGLLWASPDCKHHSKAKGSAPTRDRLIRSLAWVVEKWAMAVRPRVIMIENVEEFKSWGPLDSSGAIVKSHKGDTFRAFIRRLRRLGYKVEYNELRACDYGAPTIRKRVFIIARCDGMPIVWPEPTHGLGLLPFRAAAGIVDWSIPCPSIFERKKALVDNTLKRIAEGIKRYVIETDNPYIVDSHLESGEPHGIAIPHFQRQFGCSVGHSADQPTGTITAGGMGKTALVTAFLAKHYTGVIGHEIDKPTGTITTRDHHSIVTSNLVKLCGAGQLAEDPKPSVLVERGHADKVYAFLMKYYGKGGGQDIGDPLHTVTTKERFGLVTVMVKGEPYIITDIGMRMFSARELFRAQGFSEQYIIDVDIDGKPITKTAQVQCCGNSVCPYVARGLVEANLGIEYERVAGIKQAA